MALAFTDWWSTQVNSAWRAVMESSKAIEHVRMGYQGAVAQLPAQNADELIDENKQLHEQLAQAQERIDTLERQSRKLKELVTKMTLVLVESEEPDNGY